MNRKSACFVALALGLFVLPNEFPSAWASSDGYSPMKLDDARIRVMAWVDEQSVSDAIRQQVAAIWMDLDEAVAPERILNALMDSFSLVDQDLKKLVMDCNLPLGQQIVPQNNGILKQQTRGPFFIANVSLFYGRHLIERRLFDEAWDILKSVDARQVVDPASLFFSQAVAAQGMLEIKPALEAVDQLLTNTERVPVRYSAAAVLMQADLKAFQEKSLAEIARLMADSERRLELGRAGDKVQGVQERIISNLDEIIKKIEQQQGGGGGGGGSDQGGNSNESGGAADDSRVKGAEGPGNTDKKRFDNKGSWGNLPEKDLAKAKNDLNKNFPSHYEQAIEKYTKKLATRAAKKNK